MSSLGVSEGLGRSALSSLALSILISFLYPASLYLWPNALTRDRHAPSTIKRNFISVFGISAVSSLVLTAFDPTTGPDINDQIDPKPILHYVNWKHYHSVWAFIVHCIIWPLLHVAVLFAGPIYLDLVSFQRTYFPTSAAWKSNLSVGLKISVHFLLQLITDWAVMRNLLVAPLTEEFIFRGVLLALLRPFWGPGRAILISSCLFGLMHTHHFLRFSWLQGRVSGREAVSTACQCLYTALFGSYAAVVYLASGHLLTPILLHGFCNWNGLPNFGALAAHRGHLALTVVGFALWLLYLPPLIRAALYEG